MRLARHRARAALLLPLATSILCSHARARRLRASRGQLEFRVGRPLRPKARPTTCSSVLRRRPIGASSAALQTSHSMRFGSRVLRRPGAAPSSAKGVACSDVVYQLISACSAMPSSASLALAWSPPTSTSPASSVIGRGSPTSRAAGELGGGAFADGRRRAVRCSRRSSRGRGVRRARAVLTCLKQ